MNWFRGFDKQVKKLGWVKANKKLIKRLGINVKVEGKILKTGGVLVYSNHVTGLDPYLLISVLGREDGYCLVDVYQTTKGEQTAKRMIPVYDFDKWGFRRRSLLGKIGWLMMRRQTGFKTKQEAKKLNQQAIDQVTAKLAEGKLVIVFPGGGDKESYAWKPGLGKIIKETIKKSIKVKLFDIQIYGLNEFEMMIHLLFGKKRLKNKQVKVEIIERKIDKSWQRLNSFELSNKLKKIHEKST